MRISTSLAKAQMILDFSRYIYEVPGNEVIYWCLQCL